MSEQAAFDAVSPGSLWRESDRSLPQNEHAKALAAVRDFLTKYIVFPSEHEPVAIALWAMHAHAVDQFETSPSLAVTSAEMRSGKTLVLDCLELLVPNPFRAVTPSEATVFYVLNQRPRRTMLLDEADAIFGPRTADRYEGLRAILNSGNRRGTTVPRVKMEGTRRELEEFEIFGPKAIAGIGKLPDTVTDRCIPIRMKRRAPSEPVARFRHRLVEREAAPLREWLESLADVTVVTDVTVPQELNDRAADGWEPLIALADHAGGMWPHTARLAAVGLSAESAGEVSVGIRLLSDIRDAFGNSQHLPTADLLAALHAIEDAPWSEWYGKALTPRALSRLLDPYRVRPQHRRVDGGPDVRGYFAQDFADVWQRYLPSAEPVTSVTSVTDDAGVTDVADVTPAGAEEARADPHGYELLDRYVQEQREPAPERLSLEDMAYGE